MPSLMQEYLVLCRQLAQAQQHCSTVLAEQAAEIERLQRDNLRLRAAVVLRDTQLAIAREEHEALRAAHPGLPRRRDMALRITELIEQVRALTRERMRWQMWGAARAPAAGMPASAPAPSTPPALVPGTAGLQLPAGSVPLMVDASVAQAAAEWVICQTGCISHADYWRVQDHCRRTGRACILVDTPQAAAIDGKGVALPPVVEVRVQRVMVVPGEQA